MANRFKPARDVEWAKFLPTAPPFIVTHHRKRGARWNGIRYQRSLDAHLTGVFGVAYVAGPWMEFFDGATRERRWCQPDGLIIEPRRGRITVVEAKYTHTELAYWQLFELYIPVLETLFPRTLWTFVGVEICATYDCAIPLPSPPVMRKNILDAVPNKLNIHIWRP